MGRRTNKSNGEVTQLSLFDKPQEEGQETVPAPIVQPPEQIPQNHHHMELWYDDGHRETICTANPYTVQYDAHCHSAGYVGDVIPAGEYCPICANATPVDLPPQLDRFSFTRASLKRHSPESEARRAWLLQWAKKRGWGSYSWITHSKYDGFYKVSMEAGEAHWRRFVETGDQFQVWCCFIEARAPQSLRYYLERAVEAGELSQWQYKVEALIVSAEPSGQERMHA